MKTTTYICDICKKSVGESDLVSINLTFGLKNPESTYIRPQNFTKDACKDCLKKRGILAEVPDGMKVSEVEAKNEKTVEDKLVDILEDLGVAFTE